jgi:hypothetical protein
MRGSERIGTLKKGDQFKVATVVDGWLGTVVEEGGREKRGWVWHEHVEAAGTPLLSEN